MQRRDATTTQVLGDSGSMDSIQRSELVNAIALPVSRDKVINLLLVESNLSLKNWWNGYRIRYLSASGRHVRQNCPHERRKV